MNIKKQTRKEFLADVSKLGAAVVIGSTWLSACSGPSDRESATTTEEPATESEPVVAEKEPVPTQLEADACDDLSGLTEQEIAMREQLKYVAQSEKEGQVCTNCRFWQPTEQEGTCGGCQLIKGPIHPNGWCQSWVAMPADAS
ncbi:high-potential iron-sulfur protein [Tunicatimonas pelagia]|uniref:high-potential iron-sulfur protein n=1 Tax=Tunicatimonas pelagia TaxID=931531 RepID=UPI00266607C0|nr:high-potential iron-sulfur protein [Tunicatimonas pelagia]WKN41895.1 high-potential iron-sulfur protein [Tunicatimonas pelagia]